MIPVASWVVRGFKLNIYVRYVLVVEVRRVFQQWGATGAATVSDGVLQVDNNGRRWGSVQLSQQERTLQSGMHLSNSLSPPTSLYSIVAGAFTSSTARRAA